jgi:hypothetical protein
MRWKQTASRPPGSSSPARGGGHLAAWWDLARSRPEVWTWLLYILLALLVFLAGARQLRG